MNESGWLASTWGNEAALKYGRALRGYQEESGPTEVFGTNGPVGRTGSAPLAVGPRPVVGRKGAYRGVHLARGPFWVIDTAFWLEPGPSIDPTWAYYKLLTVDINGMDSGSAVPSLTRAHFDALPLELPPREEQLRIASVLRAFDDLIETERTIADRADELWRSVLCTHLGEPHEVPLTSLAGFVNGKNFTKGASGSGRPVIRTPEVRVGPSSSTVFNDVDASDENVAENGTILFVWSGSLLVSRWRWEPGLINQHIFKVIAGAGVPDWLVLWAIEELMDDFLGVAADKATTMGHIKRSDLERTVSVPARDRWGALDARIRPLWDEAHQARTHIVDLTRVRDELLPLLISGKVRVSEDLVMA